MLSVYIYIRERCALPHFKDTKNRMLLIVLLFPCVRGFIIVLCRVTASELRKSMWVYVYIYTRARDLEDSWMDGVIYQPEESHWWGASRRGMIICVLNND